MINKRIFFVIGFLALTCLCAGCGPNTPPKASSLVLRDQAIGLINKNDFLTAHVLLAQALRIDPYDAKANYALAICYLRQDPPNREGAIFYRNRARELGYVVPAWFDNALNPKLKAKEKKIKKRKPSPVSGKLR
jgi:hypothetical protein